MTPHDTRVAALLDALSTASVEDSLAALGHASSLVLELYDPDCRMLAARGFAITLLNTTWRELEAAHGHA